MSAHLDFSWQAPTTYTDGSVLDHNLTYNLYEDNIKIVSDIAVLNFSLLMDGKASKTYNYNVTAVDTTTHLESGMSNTLSISFLVPKGPTGLSASFSFS